MRMELRTFTGCSLATAVRARAPPLAEQRHPCLVFPALRLRLSHSGAIKPRHGASESKGNQTSAKVEAEISSLLIALLFMQSTVR